MSCKLVIIDIPDNNSQVKYNKINGYCTSFYLTPDNKINQHIHRKTYYTNGKHVGLFIWVSRDGKIKEIRHNVSFDWHRLFTYFENELSGTCYYKYSLRNGEETWYKSKGVLHYKKYYINNSLNGKTFYYNKKRKYHDKNTITLVHYFIDDDLISSSTY